MTKTYIVAPNFSMGTDSLSLGDILTEPLGADLDPLNFECRQPIDPAHLKQPTVVTSFESTRRTLLGGRFGLWTTFLATLGLPVGIDLGLFFERNSDDVIRAGELETHEFHATDAYVAEAVAKPAVRRYLEDRRYRTPPLYMVTGLKIARGAVVNRDLTARVDASSGISTAKATASIANVKPLVHFLRNRVEGVSFHSRTDFILAFRVRRITFAHGQPRHKLSLDGTSMMDGGGGKTTEAPETMLGGNMSLEEANEAAEREGIQVIMVEEQAGVDRGGEGIKWIVTDGRYAD